jgi:hypothetical protein
LFASDESVAQYVGSVIGQAVWGLGHSTTQPAAEQISPEGQVSPQPPQSAGSVAKFVQNALAPEPHASGSAGRQPQLPPAQAWPPGQTFPHAPQSAGSVAKLVQIAVAPVPHASGCEAGHEQLSLTHAWPPGQTFPHAPQLLESSESVAQYVGASGGHGVCVDEQVCTQDPLLQTCPDAHVVPHEPQLVGSVANRVQITLAPEPQASGCPAGQAQPPPVQVCSPGHTWPQVPQLPGSPDNVAQ